jgi:hypothetical protein
MATFKERIIFGLQKIKDLISGHNLDKSAHPNGFTQWLILHSQKTKSSPLTQDGQHINMGDVSVKDSTGILLSNIGSDIALKHGKRGVVTYLQAIGDPTDLNKQGTFALFTSDDGSVKTLETNAKLTLVNTTNCTSENTPTASTHIVNKAYADNTFVKQTGHTKGRAIISDANGKITISEITSTELNRLDGITNLSGIVVRHGLGWNFCIVF